jgi:dolichol kinase
VETLAQKIVRRPSVSRPAAAPCAIQRKPAEARPGPGSRSSLGISSPHDTAEQEAVSTAQKVTRMTVPESSVAGVRQGQRGRFMRLPDNAPTAGRRARRQSPYIARFQAAGIFTRPGRIQRRAEAQPNVASNVAAEIQGSLGSGSPLPLSVRRFMEPRFRAEFSGVKIHTGEKAAKLNRQLSAQAFTVGNNIFFGQGRFQPETHEGRELIAHELTHTVQQGAAVQRAEDVTIRQTSPPQVQRLGLSDALDYFAEKANLIPGFRMFTILLGINPINMSRVDRSAANILRAIIEFLPGGALITQALDNSGVFDRVGTWVEQQLRTLGMTGAAIRQAISDFLDSLSWTDIFDLGGVWNRAKRIFTEPIVRIFSFVRGLVTGIIKFIKDAILRPLASLAEGTRGYDLLKAVLGQDPITGDPYPRNADTLIGGFMKLIGQEEVWNNLKRANAAARAWAWFQGALTGLIGFVRQIPGLFLRALQSLELMDIVLVPRAFAKIARVFGAFLGQFFSWAGAQVLSLLQIIFEVIAPTIMPYIRKAAGAFRMIIQNPIGFVGNLVRAAIQGFRQFAAKFLTHLRTSLINWLTGTLSGVNVYIPQAFTLREIIKFVLSVLGLTWQNIRQKLVRVIGETAMGAIERGFEIITTLVTEGPAAAWEKIRESISNLREMVMEQIMTFVRERIVQAAITRLLTSLNPAGAFIQAILAIYNTIMFFIERLRQIAQVAMSFIDSISAIAGGALAAAANRVEQTMAGLLTLVISFLARLVGLGRVSDAITNIINRIRAPIDRALDRVVEWIVTQARRLGRLIASTTRAASGRLLEWWRARKSFTATDRSAHSLYFQGEGTSARLMVATTATPVEDFLAAIRTKATSPTTEPAVRAAFSAATAKSTLVNSIRDRVERGLTPRQPADIDALNTEMEDLADCLPPLIPLRYPPAVAAPGAAPVAIGELIKLTAGNLVALVTALDPTSLPGTLMVKFRVVSPRTERATTSLPTGFTAAAFGTAYTKYTADPRELYMGPTPGKGSSVRSQVKARMRAEGKYNPVTDQILYSRDRKWYPVAQCDMGHVIDAVTWWNSNGRLTGARSSTVISFMNNALNYEFEPSQENQRGGAALAARGLRYRPPTV